MPVVSGVSFVDWEARHFIRQKKERRAPGHNLDRPWGTSVFTGNIATDNINKGD